jgi:hypothetical protein
MATFTVTFTIPDHLDTDEFITDLMYGFWDTERHGEKYGEQVQENIYYKIEGDN